MSANVICYNPVMKKAAIFDLDGTLVSSVGIHEKAWQSLFGQYGISLSDAELREQSGKKNILFITIILERNSRTDLDPQILSDQKDDMVVEILKRRPAVVYVNVSQLLELLRTSGLKIILATSANKKTALLLGKELIPYFDAEIFGEDIEHGKPSPDIFMAAAEKIGVTKEECIVFEDATSGIEAAKAGGFFCIARDNGLGQNLARADVIVKEYDPVTILEYFKD